MDLILHVERKEFLGSPLIYGVSCLIITCLICQIDNN